MITKLNMNGLSSLIRWLQSPLKNESQGNDALQKVNLNPDVGVVYDGSSWSGARPLVVLDVLGKLCM